MPEIASSCGASVNDLGALGTEGWILALTAVLVVLTVILAVVPLVLFWFDSRGFKIQADADKLHRVRVQFNLKGTKSHAIQRVEPVVILPLGFRVRHWLWGRKKKTDVVVADPSTTNPTPPVTVGDPADRVFVWTVRRSNLPRHGVRATGYEQRVPDRKKLRVLIRVDDRRRFFLKRVRSHEPWAEPPHGSPPVT